MASITKRGERWFVRIIRKGHEPIRKTFVNRRDAEAFAACTEADIARGTYRRIEGERTTYREILERYAREVSPCKRGAADEASHIKSMLRPDGVAKPLLARPIASVSAQDVARWRDARLKQVAVATLLREWSILTHAFTICRQEWGFIGLESPFSGVRKPTVDNSRERRVSQAEVEAICAATASQELAALVRLAIETAARRGELLALQWRDVDLKKRTARLASVATKNGYGRTLPLSGVAVDVLKSMPRRLDGGTVFTLRPDSVTQAFGRAVERARTQYEADCVDRGIEPDHGYLEDLRFHDLRHEACSRLAELGLSTTELASVSGHRTLQLLGRYVHHRVETLVAKIA